MQIKSLLDLVKKENASDLLLTATSSPVLRINTDLVYTDLPKLTNETAKELIYEILSEPQKAAFEKEKELDIACQHGESRFRINVHYERGNIAASIRRIPLKVPGLAELRLPKIIGDLSKLIRGLILVTGPTGSGKSTTQACMLDIINASRPCHIITVEDPIEYIHPNKKAIVEQREVGIDTNSFGHALRRVLRQNPDVIFVGEMRDLETIQTAVTAAETGHLVISTLHTPDAAQAVDRMIDVFPPHQQMQIRLQVSLTLQAIVSQQLLPKKDKSGVVPAIEVLLATPAVRNIIRKATTQDLYSVIETSAKQGMVSMDTALKDLHRSGLISSDEAMFHARNSDELGRALGIS